MKPAKRTKKASAAKAPKTDLQVNIEYVEHIADEAIATIMAMRALIRQLAEKLEEQK